MQGVIELVPFAEGVVDRGEKEKRGGKGSLQQ